MSRPAGFPDDFHQRMLSNILNSSLNQDQALDSTDSSQCEEGITHNTHEEIANRSVQRLSKVRKTSSKVRDECKTVHNLKRVGENRTCEIGNTHFITGQKSTVEHELGCLGLARSAIKHGLKSLWDDVRVVDSEEKKKLGELLSKTASRFSLAIDRVEDFWILTVYYVNEAWKLERKFVDLQHFSPIFSKKSLRDLIIESNVHTRLNSIVCLDRKDIEESNCLFKDGGSRGFRYEFMGIQSLEGYFESIYNFEDQGFEIRSDGDIRRKLETCFGHVHRFLSKNEELKHNIMTGKKVNLQDLLVKLSCRYNYKTVASALEFKEVFLELEHLDPNFKSISLTNEDWDIVTIYSHRLKVLTEVTSFLSGYEYITANVWIHLICKVYKRLLLHESSDNYTREFASLLKKNFVHDYWNKCGVALAIAAVLDPRFKLDVLKDWYKMIYKDKGEEHIQKFIDDFKRIYSCYINPRSSTFMSVSEVDLYIREPVRPVYEDFEILAWWHNSMSRFPTLAKMAGDFLAIPFQKNISAINSKLSNMEDVSRRSDFCFPEIFVSTKCFLEENCEDPCLEDAANHLFQGKTKMKQQQFPSLDQEIGDHQSVQCSSSTIPHPKQRKLRSKVWNEFRKIITLGKEDKAVCNHCENEFVGSSRKGTSHLLNHLKICPQKETVDHESNDLELARRIIKRGCASFVDDITLVYKEEKQKVADYLNKQHCRFSVSAPYRDFITIHFIDQFWKPKRKILWARRIKELNIEINLCCVVADTESEVKKVTDCLSDQGCVSFCGKFFRCASFKTHIEYFIFPEEEKEPLHDIVDDVMHYDILDKMIDCLKYAQDRFHDRFSGCHEFMKPYDCDHPFYENLKIIMKFKKEFQELEHTDPEFKSINLDWDVVTACYDCLRVIEDATDRLSEKKYTTANVCFRLIHDIYKMLGQKGSHNYWVQEIVAHVRERFLKYYSDESVLALKVAVVLDPCSKMKLVEDWYRMIYGKKAEEHILRFDGELQGIYKFYLDDSNSHRSPTFISADVGSHKSELYRYLETPVCPMSEDFEILAWWRNSVPDFPTLAKMARDFLAIPIWTDSYALEQEMEDIIGRDLNYFYRCTILDWNDLNSDFWLDCMRTKLWLEGPEVE